MSMNSSRQWAAKPQEAKAMTATAAYRAPATATWIADEDEFDHLLSLERRRTERTGDPLLLVIFDLSLLSGNSRPAKAAHISRAIRSATRDTDILGWYAFPHVLGLILTTLSNDSRTDARVALTAKLDSALRSVLQPAEISKLLISYHFFPENFDGAERYRSDEKLYRDLFTEEKSRAVHHFFKRALDVVGSIFALVLFSPLFLIVPALIKLTSPGPVLFRQRRIGRFGREFSFLKFRTMYVNNSPEIHEQYVRKLILEPEEVATDGKTPLYKIGHDPRVTRVGRFLRKSSLDELPQFINVLRGEMSLVGPRPPLPYEVAIYRSWHRRRIVEVKPGITGLWQVYGRSRTTFDEMVRLDLRYVRNQSIWLDLKILVKTPMAVLSGDGAV